MSRAIAGAGWLGPAAIALTVHATAALVPVRFGGAEDPTPAPVQLAIEPPPATEPLPEPEPEPEQPTPEMEDVPPPQNPPPPVRPPEPPPSRVTKPAPETVEATPEPVGLDAELFAEKTTSSALPRLEHALDEPPPPAPPAAEVDLSGYRAGLHRALSEARRYPMLARRLGLEGEAEVRIVVGQNGALLRDPELLESTGHDVLDEEVLRLAKAVAPYPPLPDGYTETEAEFLIPVVFELGH